MKTSTKPTEKVNLNTNIAEETDRKLERLKMALRQKKAKKGATTKGALIDILVMSPEAQQILERALL